MILTTYESVSPYVTKDGSIIRELMHPDTHGNANLSLAEATVPVESETLLHRHIRSEEIYHITEGKGLLTVGDEHIHVKAGDTVCIPPAVCHRIRNTGLIPLRFLCCCSPAYSHSDTVMSGQPE